MAAPEGREMRNSEFGIRNYEGGRAGAEASHFVLILRSGSEILRVLRGKRPLRHPADCNSPDDTSPCAGEARRAVKGRPCGEAGESSLFLPQRGRMSAQLTGEGEKTGSTAIVSASPSSPSSVSTGGSFPRWGKHRLSAKSASCHSEPVTDVTGVGIRIPKALRTQLF